MFVVFTYNSVMQLIYRDTDGHHYSQISILRFTYRPPTSNQEGSQSPVPVALDT